jgi:hypothetical protein
VDTSPWRYDALEHSPGYAAFEVIETPFGVRVGDAFCAPFLLGDAERLLSLCAAAGLFDAKVTRHDRVVPYAWIRSLVSTEGVSGRSGLLDDRQLKP